MSETLALTLEDKVKANAKIMNLSNGKALRRTRELLKVSRQELAKKLGVSYKSVEKYENGRSNLSDKRISEILNILGVDQYQFLSIKKGKGGGLRKREAVVVKNQDRRSYKRIITKECQVLRSMRRERNLSQDEASAVCGYSRPTIGHIENGRIELSRARITRVVLSYGFSMDEFEDLVNAKTLRSEIIDCCVEQINRLSNEKLGILSSLLANL